MARRAAPLQALSWDCLWWVNPASVLDPRSSLITSFCNCSSGLFGWSQVVMARSPSNSHSHNYTGLKLFTTLRPQSNFRINLRFDGELVEVLKTWNVMLGLLNAPSNSSGRPRVPGAWGAVLSLATQGRKSISQ